MNKTKTLEWQCGMWFASLNLRIAFNEVGHGTLFAALTAHGIWDNYSDVLVAPYQACKAEMEGEIDKKRFEAGKGR